MPAVWQKNCKGLGRGWLRYAEEAERRRLHRVEQGSAYGLMWYGME